MLGHRLSLLTLAALLLATFTPLAAGEPTCVKRPDGQNLACVGVVLDGAATCVSESLNPPVPDFWQSSTLCVDRVLAQLNLEDEG